MKQIEITMKVNEEIDKVIKKLEEQGFKNIRKSDVHDIYMTQKIEQLKKDNIQEILSSCILLRNVKSNDKEIKKITYKNKQYNNNQVVAEEKVEVNCDNLERAKELFEHINFQTLIEVKYHVLVMKKDNIELAFQDVEGLGLLLELENENDFENKSIEEIEEEKIKMYNLVKSIGLNISKEYDIKKAEELIIKKYFQKY